MYKKENAFQEIRQGTKTVSEYKLCMFVMRAMDEQEFIRRFMKSWRVDYHSMVELVEKVAIKEMI